MVRGRGGEGRGGEGRAMVQERGGLAYVHVSGS